MTDWEAKRLRIKARVSATQDRLEQLARRREELAVRPTTTKDLQRAHQRMLEAAQHAAAARRGAANQFEQFANVHDAVARAHATAAKNAPNDLLVIAHLHGAETHRSAARHDRELARRYREQTDDY